MVNILPEMFQKKLRASYYTRLANAFLLLASLVILVGIAFLAPSYLLAQEEAVSAERFKNTIEELLNIKGTTGASKDLGLIDEELALLNSYATTPFMPVFLGAILEAQSAGISLQKITLTFDEAGLGHIRLEGKAATRTHLVDFVHALQQQPQFESVAVPVSNLTSETDVTFTLPFAFRKP